MPPQDPQTSFTAVHGVTHRLRSTYATLEPTTSVKVPAADATPWPAGLGEAISSSGWQRGSNGSSGTASQDLQPGINRHGVLRNCNQAWTGQRQRTQLVTIPQGMAVNQGHRLSRR